MMFSVLLPTHNRLDLLRSAVETVRWQDYDEWEVVVSDNASTDDVAGYVEQIADSRVRYVRTPAFLPVTDSWNYALKAATGDYVVMLGDDDGLLPGYFRCLRELVEAHDRPELVYHSALLFAYPGVLPDHPGGFLQDITGSGLVRSADGPYKLSSDDAHERVSRAMRFEMGLAFNMQFSLVSRELIMRIERSAALFQSAFPDYYATLAMLLEARSIVVDPCPRVVIGISPKSYGFFHFNRREKEGMQFLAGRDGGTEPELRPLALPGNNINTGWLDAMLTLEKNYGAKHGLTVSYWRYRFIQTTFVYVGHYVLRQISRTDLRELHVHLTRSERLLADVGIAVYGGGRRILLLLRRMGVKPPMRRAHEVLGRSPVRATTSVPTVFRDVVDVFLAAQSAGTVDPRVLADVAEQRV